MSTMVQSKYRRRTQRGAEVSGLDDIRLPPDAGNTSIDLTYLLGKSHT